MLSLFSEIVNNKNQRKGTLNKACICAHICFSMKVIHLELLTDLTSDALIAIVIGLQVDVKNAPKFIPIMTQTF